MSILHFQERQTRKAKKLTADNGILTPNLKKGKTLDSEIENLVKKFYLDDENSHMIPGMKDFISVKKDDGRREHVKKKLILCNLSELYANFKARHPTVKICLSKFSQLRPRNCILAGVSGTHTVCVCVHHEIVNLMLDAVGLKEPTMIKLPFLQW